MTKEQIRLELEYYGIPAIDLDDATEAAAEYLEDNPQLDLAAWAEAYGALL